ncbi:GNAT family N-acetyltransferase [Clostridium sp. AM58-1XD]|uniref:GNAT family N-acetyltransferase n=1 Tax=Clostridium sp. AM58-1XD TaxID=2292307 RepID=UPI000E4D7DD2|nr:GNAT family N-acetyltransferase [Clostridium sp. AM58-1XD]RGY97248.1 GNAT family N-acetyltransferase [Clostridium sp. AM58-1XD]
MNVQVRKYEPEDIPAMTVIWNEVVEDGVAFPQTELLNDQTGCDFFSSQTYCGVAENEAGELLGLYILHPNNVGRCGHICNASYAVRSSARGMRIGEKLVADCLKQGKELGFRILQFNAVVRTNEPARRLYEKLGFVQLGVIPGGFLMKDGHYEDICPYYRELCNC